MDVSERDSLVNLLERAADRETINELAGEIAKMDSSIYFAMPSEQQDALRESFRLFYKGLRSI